MSISNMKWRISGVVIICIIAVMLVTAGCKKQDSDSLPSLTPEAKKGSAVPKEVKKTASDPSKVLVEVDGKKFTQGEAEAEINSRLGAYMGQIPEPQLEQIREKFFKEMVNNFVTRTLLTEAADKEKVTVSDAEVNAAIDKIKASLPQGMTLQEALQRNGLTEDKMRTDIQLGLRINKIVESQVKDQTAPSDKEIQDYYTANKKTFEVPETVHARHVLVKTDEKDDQKTKDAKRAKAEDVQKKLQAGADFASVAKDSSDCPSKAKGGDLGTFQRGQMVKPFEDAAFSQEVKVIGPVVETRFGYHVIQVLEHNQPRTKSLTETKDTIAKNLQQKRLQEAAEKYVAELKTKAHIVYAPDSAAAKP